MKFIITTFVAFVLVCFSVPNVNEAQADRVLLTMPPILASPNVIKDPPPPPPPPFGTVVSAGGRIWMDRNLGASQVATSSTDSAAYGDLYQWGRGTDGHEKRTSPITTTTSATDVPGHGKFIINYSSPYDWRVPQNDNLWQGSAATTNPCITGFRLPTEEEWLTEWLSWGSGDSLNNAFASPLKLVGAGVRYARDSVIRGEGNGYYWSSSVSSDGSARLLWVNGAGGGMFTRYRAHGASVRCIKD